MAGAVTHNDIWKAAMISVTIRSWEPLTDPRGTLNITRPHNANTSRMNLLQKNPSNDGDKCVQFNQTARKKRNDCVRDPVTNKKTLTTTQSNLLSSIKAAKCSSRDHTTQRKHWWTLALFFFCREGNWRPTTMWFQASERAPRAHHGGMMFSTRPHNATTRRTTAQLHTQDNWTKCHHATKYSEETSYKCEGQWCVSQDHTVQISQWSSLAPLHNQENTMSTKLVCKCPPEILVVWSVFVTELYAKMSLFLTIRHKNTRGWHPPCQPSLVKESLSDLGGMVFITKTYSTNVAMTIRETLSRTTTLNKFHMRTNTSGQYTMECHSAKCVSIPRPHNATFTKIITETPFNKNCM